MFCYLFFQNITIFVLKGNTSIMKGIIDKKGISQGKLEHIFLGTIKYNITSGFHCDKDFGDENVYAEAHSYSKSKRIITANKNQKIFEAYVRNKFNKKLKTENFGKSTFFNKDWSRQDVVDCIDRIHQPCSKLLKEYNNISKNKRKRIYIDTKTGMVLVDNQATTFPLLKY